MVYFILIHKQEYNIRKLKHILFLTFAVGFMHCGEETPVEENPIQPNIPDIIIPEIVPHGEEKYLNTNSDYIFDQGSLRTYHLTIPNSSLNAINANPAVEQYVEGMLVFEGDTISPVGIRYKGSIGGFVNCVSGDDWANPSGSKICTKLSMKVKINWEGREEKFYKLRKLQFHSQNLDPSQMHERLGYWLFREMGISAPRSVHAKLNINGEYAGLFALTEQIDGRFVNYNFDDDEGNLYKEVWPLDSWGNPTPAYRYINALKTNEDNDPNVDIIHTFGTLLSNAEDSELPSIVEEYMDIGKIIRYAVVDRAIRHDDGPFHWYCGGGACTNHNYYFYEEPNRKKLHLIPWDLDNAFENIITNSNPVTPIADAWGQTTNNCKPFSYGSFGFWQWSASCDPLTATWTSFEDEYAAAKLELINGPLLPSRANAMIDKWADQIYQATQDASTAHHDAISIADWQAELSKLKSQLEYIRNH